MAKVLRERWRVYKIDDEGRLKEDTEYYYGQEEMVFERYGYETEQQAMNAILHKSQDVKWRGPEYTIVKTYQAVDEDKS